MMSFVNRRHVSLERLETAQRELIELYLRLDLPKHWGNGKTVAADGTQYDFYDNNLLAGYHFRYRKMSAVAYRHVADNYIVVFRHFIPPGVWEAIYVIDGLLKAGLSIEADMVHSDTQGQSAAVFAFTYLLGINPMPRIRDWPDLKMYKADENTQYKHIERLFSGNWGLIAFHWWRCAGGERARGTAKASALQRPDCLGGHSPEHGRHDAGAARNGERKGAGQGVRHRVSEHVSDPQYQALRRLQAAPGAHARSLDS